MEEEYSENFNYESEEKWLEEKNSEDNQWL